jgi:hypothetical protein
LTEINHWPTFPAKSGSAGIVARGPPVTMTPPRADELTAGKPNHIGILSRGPLLNRVPGGNI